MKCYCEWDEKGERRYKCSNCDMLKDALQKGQDAVDRAFEKKDQ